MGRGSKNPRKSKSCQRSLWISHRPEVMVSSKNGYLKNWFKVAGFSVCIWWSFKNRLHVRLLILIIIRIAFNLRIRFCRFLCGFFCWAWTWLWSVTTTTSGWSLSTSGISHQFSCALMTIPKIIKWNFQISSLYEILHVHSFSQNQHFSVSPSAV